MHARYMMIYTAEKKRETSGSCAEPVQIFLGIIVLLLSRFSRFAVVRWKIHSNTTGMQTKNLDGKEGSLRLFIGRGIFSSEKLFFLLSEKEIIELVYRPDFFL